MKLYETAFNPAQYQQMQQPQMGGMLGSMMGGQDWQSQLGNIDMENMMPGLGMDMQSGKLGMSNWDASNEDVLNYDIDALNAPEGAFGTQDAYSRSFGLGRGQPGSFDLGGGQSQYSMMDYLGNQPPQGSSGGFGLGQTFNLAPGNTQNYLK